MLTLVVDVNTDQSPLNPADEPMMEVQDGMGRCGNDITNAVGVHEVVRIPLEIFHRDVLE